MNHTHVVIGATGALGQSIVLRLMAEGYPVRAVARDADRARAMLPDEVEIATADAAELQSLQAVCQDAAVIYNGVYVPSQQWPGVTENFIVTARDTGARLVFPSNIHPYGPLQQTPAAESHPLAATSMRGRMRIRIETMLMDAARAGDVQVTIPRLAAFYGPTIREGFLHMIFQSALAGRKAEWYANLDAPYDLVYTDDAASACMLLGAGENTAGQVWHVPGAGALTGRQFITLVYEAAGAPPEMSVRSRRTFQALGLVYPQAKSFLEVLYEFEQPLVMDGRKFAQAFPDFQYTPHEEAVRETMEWMRQAKGA